MRGASSFGARWYTPNNFARSCELRATSCQCTGFRCCCHAISGSVAVRPAATVSFGQKRDDDLKRALPFRPRARFSSDTLTPELHRSEATARR